MSQKLKRVPTHLKKSLLEYLSKIKNPSSDIKRVPSKNWLPSGCKHSRTLSIPNDGDRNNDQSDKNDHSSNRDYDNNSHNNGAATLADIDRFLYENFKSLYIQDNDDNKTVTETEGDREENGERDDRDKVVLFDESPSFIAHRPNRIFLKPVTSGSLINEDQTSLTVSSDNGGSSSTSNISTTNKIPVDDSPTSSNNDSKDVTLSHDCIAILKSSSSPYDDFRASMQEMAKARLQHQAQVDWDFMDQLLFNYLNLNQKRTHKFILRAFVDLVVELRQNPNNVPARPRHFSLARSQRRRRSRLVT